MSSPPAMETQSAVPALEHGYRLSYACDHCRLRKVRCDGQDPCQPCASANKECKRARMKKPREKKQRLLVSAQYEKKIGMMEERLDTLVNLLAEKNKTPTPVENLPQTTLTTSLSPATTTPASRLQDSDPTFEGESSMLAHSRFASDLMEKTLLHSGSDGLADDCSETVTALKKLVTSLKPRHESQDAWFDDTALVPPPPPRTELPPFAVVASAFKVYRDNDRSSFNAWFIDVISIETLTQHAMDVYFSTYTHSQLIIVTAHLMWLIQKEQESATESAQRELCRSNAKLCQVAFETTIGNLPFCMPATKETVYAIFLSALHAMSSFKPALSWTLICRAAELCQSLGYHRSVTMKADDGRAAQQKISIFWWVYILDKALSLRLGRYSNIQNSEVDVPAPYLIDAHADPAGFGHYFNITICCARLQGKVYEQLYSAGSRCITAQEREARVYTLTEELSLLQDELRNNRAKMLQSIGPQAREHIILQGDQVALLSLSTLVYRALTPLGGIMFERRCVDTARSALRFHEQCVSGLGHGNVAALEEYINWAILYTPFVPVIVVLCNAIETVDPDDLQLLQGFVATFQPASNSSPTIGKLHDRFNTLSEIASRIIELRTAAASKNGPGTSTYQVDNMMEDNFDQTQPRAIEEGQDLTNPTLNATQNAEEFPNPAYSEAWFQDYQQMLDQLGEDDMFLFGTNILREF